jgi:glucokinase
MSEQVKAEYVVGVDLGGTKILAGVFDARLRCAGRDKISTKPDRGPDVVVKRIARCIEDAVDECDLTMKQIRAVGIGGPGAIDPEKGIVFFAPNLGWRDYPLKKNLEKELGIPVFIENDCNAAMLGVYQTELAAKPKNAIGVFVGTGIGGGIIIDGKLFSGFNRTAGEVGHMIIEVGGPKCNCGNRGCLEALASRTAISRTIAAAVKDGQKTLLADLTNGNFSEIRSGDLRKAIRKGDKLVEKVIEEAAEYIGIGVANLINIFSPEVVVLGGGVIAALEDEMMAIVVATAEDYAVAGTMNGVQIIASKAADDACITGSAVLALKGGKV